MIKGLPLITTAIINGTKLTGCVEESKEDTVLKESKDFDGFEKGNVRSVWKNK